jgi:hypothetical protein
MTAICAGPCAEPSEGVETFIDLLIMRKRRNNKKKGHGIQNHSQVLDTNAITLKSY